MYSEIKVLPKSDEFKEVAARIRQSLPDATIVTLTRIQNNYLLAQYITNLSMRKKSGEIFLIESFFFTEQGMSNRAKFIGTLILVLICNMQRSLKCLEKAYILPNARYFHNYSYKVDPWRGRYKMILADVFLGKIYESKTALKV